MSRSARLAEARSVAGMALPAVRCRRAAPPARSGWAPPPAAPSALRAIRAARR
jgi:2-methylcitrate dehydratase PrpD